MSGESREEHVRQTDRQTHDVTGGGTSYGAGATRSRGFGDVDGLWARRGHGGRAAGDQGVGWEGRLLAGAGVGAGGGCEEEVEWERRCVQTILRIGVVDLRCKEGVDILCGNERLADACRCA